MRSPAYLADHQVQGSAVTPAAAYIEQGLAAAEEVFGPGRHGLANLAIQQAMFLPEGVRRRVQVSIAPESGGESTFETYSSARRDDGGDRPRGRCTRRGRWCMNRKGDRPRSESSDEPNHRFGRGAGPGGERSRRARSFTN